MDRMLLARCNSCFTMVTGRTPLRAGRRQGPHLSNHRNVRFARPATALHLSQLANDLYFPLLQAAVSASPFRCGTPHCTEDP